LDLHQPALALEAYESALKEAPNRFNSLYGAARAAQLGGDEDLYSQVVLCEARRGRRPWHKTSRVAGGERVSLQ